MDQNFPQRKSPRLKGFDYNAEYAYFVTVCTQDRKCLLSHIVGTTVPTNKVSALSSFVASFKRLCTKQYGHSIWQVRYYDHIIRNDKDYQNHLRYIDENPLRWELDELYRKA